MNKYIFLVAALLMLSFGYVGVDAADTQKSGEGLGQLLGVVANTIKVNAKQTALAIRKEAAVTVHNGSDQTVGFFMMALYGTTDKTPLYYSPLKCYIAQSIVSDPVTVTAGASNVLSLNESGKELVGDALLFGLTLVAVQEEINTDPLAGQYKNLPQGVWVTNQATGEKKFVPSSQVFAQKVVVKAENKNYFTKITTSWVSNIKKKKLVLKPAAQNNFEFPADFILDKKVSEDFDKPDYKAVIEIMKKAEERMNDKIFEAKFFNEAYLKTLPDKDVYALYAHATRILSTPVNQMAGLGSMFQAMGKYKYVASILVQAAIGVVITILTGGAAATMIGDLVQQAISTGTDLAQEISDIKARD